MISVPSLLLIYTICNDSVFSFRVLDVEFPSLAYSQTAQIMPDAKKASSSGKRDHNIIG
jgi:hypothetical protein